MSRAQEALRKAMGQWTVAGWRGASMELGGWLVNQSKRVVREWITYSSIFAVGIFLARYNYWIFEGISD